MSGVKVAVRIRPLSQKEKDAGVRKCCSVLSGTNVVVIKREQRDPYLKSQGQGVSEYEFDEAFDDNATQLEVYEKTTKPYLKNLIAGLNVTVFAYGATGAGKTHTMMGNARCDDATNNAEAGIIPNSLTDLFAMLQDKRENAAPGERYEVSCSFMEVYNEQVYDLVEPTGKVLQICEDAVTKAICVRGLATKKVPSPEAVFELLTIGNKNRKTEATCANQVSSRSHAILQLTLTHVRVTDSGREAVTESKMNLIDLAGSERASATNNRGVRLQEGANINKSLLALANCINSLATNNNGKQKRTNVKYRDSKLTHLLKSSLEGNCNLIMIANVNPSHITYEDSHNTLKYSNRAKNIKVDPKAMENAKDSSWVEREHRLRDENARLRKRVAELEAENKALRTSNKDYAQRSSNSPEESSTDVGTDESPETDVHEDSDDDSSSKPTAVRDDASFEVGSTVEAWGTPSAASGHVSSEAQRVHDEAQGLGKKSSRSSLGANDTGSERPWARRARRASITSLQRAPSAPSSLNTLTKIAPPAAIGNLPDIPETGAAPKEDDYKAQIDKLAAIAKDQQQKLDFLLSKENNKHADVQVSPGKRNRENYENKMCSSPLPALVASQEALVDLSAVGEGSMEEVTVIDHTPVGSTDLGAIMGDLLEEAVSPVEPVRVPTPPPEPLARMNKKRRGSFIPQPRRALEDEAVVESAPNLKPGRRHTRLSTSHANANANHANIEPQSITVGISKPTENQDKGVDVGSNLQSFMSNGIRAINERILGKENAAASKREAEGSAVIRGHVAVVDSGSGNNDLWRDL